MSEELKEVAAEPRAEKRKVLVDVKIIIEPRIGYVYIQSGETRMEAFAREYESWASDFKSFLRDHRSQDVNSMDVEREYQDQCSLCGNEWEPATDDDSSEPYCAHCGKVIQP